MKKVGKIRSGRRLEEREENGGQAHEVLQNGALSFTAFLVLVAGKHH